MGIRDYFRNRRYKRFNEDMERYRKEFEFNPALTARLGISEEQDFSQTIQEYKIWAQGNPYALRLLYHTWIIGTNSFFWRRVPDGNRMIHSGLPSRISNAMANILFGNPLTLKATVFNEGKIDEKKTKAATDVLKEVFDEIGFSKELIKGAVSESVTGHVFYKFSVDTDLSPLPILECCDVTQARVEKERGKTIAIVFKSYLEYKGEKYCLHERYGRDEKGDATIEYSLWNAEKEVPLTAIPQTYDLAENPKVTFEGIQGLLAFEKPNKTPSLRFPNSPYGASDYEGAIPSFDGLDEIVSELSEETRTNKTKVYIPDNMIPKKEVKLANGKTVLKDDLRDDFTQKFVKVTSDPDQKSADQITWTQIPDKYQSLMEKLRFYLTNAINVAGLSPFALGITGLESVSASAESQQERNKTTIDTRKMKVQLWTPFLENMLTRCLELTSWIKQHADVELPFDIDQLDYENTAVSVDFGDYVQDTQKELLTDWGNAYMQKIVSLENVVRHVNKNMSEDELTNELNLIKIEQGMSVDNPNALPELDSLINEVGDVGER